MKKDNHLEQLNRDIDCKTLSLLEATMIWMLIVGGCMTFFYLARAVYTLYLS